MWARIPKMSCSFHSSYKRACFLHFICMTFSPLNLCCLWLSKIVRFSTSKAGVVQDHFYPAHMPVTTMKGKDELSLVSQSWTTLSGNKSDFLSPKSYLSKSGLFISRLMCLGCLSSLFPSQMKEEGDWKENANDISCMILDGQRVMVCTRGRSSAIPCQQQDGLKRSRVGAGGRGKSWNNFQWNYILPLMAETQQENYYTFHWYWARSGCLKGNTVKCQGTGGLLIYLFAHPFSQPSEYNGRSRDWPFQEKEEDAFISLRDCRLFRLQETRMSL